MLTNTVRRREMKKLFLFVVIVVVIGLWGVSSLNAQTVTATVNVGGLPISVGVNAMTNKIYVANLQDDTVSVIDGATDTVTATVNVGGGPWGVGVNATTNKIYVANSADETVSVIDGATDTVTATVNVGNGPISVGVNATTNKIYVANFTDETVSVIEDAPSPAPTTPVPTLNEWGLIILSLLMIGIGYITIRRRNSASV